MQVREHAETAREFLVASDKEFEADDLVQASEKLWGAAAHAVMAVAQERGWYHRSHRSLKNAVTRLAREQGDPTLEMQFGLAEKFHRNFYHDDMEDWERDVDRPHVHDFVERVLALLGSRNGREGE